MAELTLTLTQQQYEALIALAREGTKSDEGQVNQERALRLDAFLRDIEEANGISRSAVWVQWQDANEPLPPTTKFPDVWPPEKRAFIELIRTEGSTRVVSRADVDAVLDNRANQPLNVLVTSDPAARVGWTPVDDFFF